MYLVNILYDKSLFKQEAHEVDNISTNTSRFIDRDSNHVPTPSRELFSLSVFPLSEQIVGHAAHV